MDGSLVIIIVLVALSAAFSAAEIALTSLSPARVQALKQENRFGSRAVFRLKKNPQNMLITILIGNNLVNISATVLATVWGMKTFGSHAIGIVTGVLTFVILFFGEITPKTIAQKYAVNVACLLSYPLLGLSYLLYPVIFIFYVCIHGLMKLFNAKNPIKTMTEEELLAMVDIGTKEGVIEEHEQEFIENVLEFTDTTAEEIMTLEKDAEVMDASTTVEEAAHKFMDFSHTRIPVFKKDLNNIIGIITVHDILRLLQKEEKNKALGELHYQKVIVVPKTKSISRLFREFQKRRQHIAIIVDEHGDTVGLVTLEDILEEIVGDIADEEDISDITVRKIGKNEWEADGDATIEELNEALKAEIAYPEHETVSLLILEQVQGFPKKGEKIIYGNLQIQVMEMGKNRIEKVCITKLPKSAITEKQ